MNHELEVAPEVPVPDHLREEDRPPFPFPLQR